MSQVVDGLVAVVAGLDPEDRTTLVDRLISSRVLSESAEDALVIASRRNEPTTSYREFRKRRLGQDKTK